MKIMAAVCYEPHRPLQIEEVELRNDLDAYEVLVRNVASGVCHTDILFRDAPEGVPFMPRPSVLGHEGCGIVERVGSSVTTLKPGDHVVMSYHFDGNCPSCRAGLQSYCERYVEFNLAGIDTRGEQPHQLAESTASIMHQQSSFATYSICTENNSYKVDPELPLENLGPIGCGFLTGAGGIVNMLKPVKGSSIVIFGLGAVGFAATAMASKMGCGNVIVVDLHKHRLDLAIDFGATILIDPADGDAVEQILEKFPDGVDYCLEATGVPEVMSQATEVVGPGGHCLICGGVSDPDAKAQFSAMPMLFNKHIHGALMGHGRPTETINLLLDMIASEEFPIDKLVQHYEFDQINDAIADMESGKTIKPVLRMPV